MGTRDELRGDYSFSGEGVAVLPLVADSPSKRKSLGSYYTPPNVAQTLVRWVVRSPSDKMLDPACGDGRFLAAHSNVVGIDRDVSAVVAVARVVPHATVVAADFFAWASDTKARFDCVAGNPPFIRYQQFNGSVRESALQLCSRLGVKLTGLASSWVPFVIVAASLLKPGGRLAFIVPAEIGHAPYARPLIRYLLDNFSNVHVVAVREKIFPELSEDVWLVYANGFGKSSDSIVFSAHDSFSKVPKTLRGGERIDRPELEAWNFRLRPFLLSRRIRDLYAAVRRLEGTVRLGDLARVGIGYVTGANDFFHLRPSDAKRIGIPEEFLVPSVRRSSFLPQHAVTQATVKTWLSGDEPVLLLNIPVGATLPKQVQSYLDSSSGKKARTAYKCRVRSPWYAVPDVRVPDAFLGYMSGLDPNLVANRAGCVCTNSIHAVHLTNGTMTSELLQRWSHPLVPLSCELEGHPLGGGMLKLEPREAARIVLPDVDIKVSERDRKLIEEGVSILRRWRHYA
jgi:adenine-specific DNA-methyltransferase